MALTVVCPACKEHSELEADPAPDDEKSAGKKCPACGAPLEASSGEDPNEDSLPDVQPAPLGLDPAAMHPIARVGRYLLFDEFARGGMATVHLGRLDGAGGFSRVVAIKRLHTHLLKDAEFTRMLLKEARLAARIRHPNVIPMLDVVSDAGEVLLVMEYVDGESLSPVCRRLAKQYREVPFDIVTRVMADVLNGLHAVHEAVDEKGERIGLIHRDVSPQNIMVGTEGAGRVFDFGVAKAMQHVEHTAPHRIKGKSAYMSPEQIRGETLTHHSDVFAAGIVTWEFITLRRLFGAANEHDRMDRIQAGHYPAPSERRDGVPEALDRVVMKALALDPADRFDTAQEFAEALEEAVRPATPRQVAEWLRPAVSDSLEHRARLMNMVETWGGSTREAAEEAARVVAERVSMVSIHDGLGDGVRTVAKSRSNRTLTFVIVALVGCIVIALAVAAVTGTLAP